MLMKGASPETKEENAHAYYYRDYCQRRVECDGFSQKLHQLAVSSLVSSNLVRFYCKVGCLAADLL